MNESKNVSKSQAKHDSKEDCEIWVLKAQASDEGEPGEEASIQKAVYDELKRNCLCPQWISVDECLRIAKRKNEIFVLPRFTGQVFDHLSKIHCRIYGSLAVLSCLNARERLPKWTHPVESVTLRNIVVCFTGFDYSIRETQTSLIMRMGGIVSRDFNADVTHLVAPEHNSSSKKYIAAIQRAIPIMSIEWLEKAWEATCKFSELRFSDDDIVQMFRLKLFSGCLMTCSGVSLEERLLLGQLVEENGGKFKGDMERYKCTHLLTDKNSGEKYRKAREWGWDTIKIVRLAWLAKCIEKGYRIPENLYEPKVPIKCSTPKSSLSESPACLDFSAIPRAKLRNYNDVDHNGTSINSTLNGVLADGFVAGSTNVVDKSDLVENRTLRKSFSARLINDSRSVDPFPDFDISRLECNDDLLEGLRIYFHGMNKAVLTKYKRMASSVGASVSSVLNETITHVVLGVLSNELKLTHELVGIPSSCVIVKCDWLVECAKANRLISTSNYLISVEADNENSEENHTLMNSSPTASDRMSTNNLKTGAFGVSQRTTVCLSSTSRGGDLISDQKQLMPPKNDSLKKLTTSAASQLIDSPSVFLDPKKNFISRFDLRKAYEHVNDLHSFEQSICSVQSDLSESTVEKVLNEAIVKTAVKTACTEKVSPNYGGEESENTGEALQPSKFDTPVSREDGSSICKNNQRTVSNEDKRRMIERCLASLANYEGEKRSESPGDKNPRKRILSKLKGTLDEPSIKRRMENLDSDSNALLCDSNESIGETGNIGWVETNVTRTKRTTSDASDHGGLSLFEEDCSCFRGKEKKIPLNFNMNEEVIFIEKQNATVTSFLSNENNEEGNNEALDYSNASSKDKKASLSLSRKRDSGIPVPTNQKEFINRPVSVADSQPGVESGMNIVSFDRCNNPSSSMSGDMIFLLSSLEESARARYANIITRLGGQLSLEFNDAVKFLVCGEIIRNEKLLTSVACGLFILRPEFLDESDSAGHWLEPEIYEWGNIQFLNEHKFSNKKAKGLAQACRRWRLKINEMNPRRKAFHNWKVILYCSRRRSIEIGRIISSGGGFFALRDDVDTFDGFTHALVEKSKYWNDQEIANLVGHNLKCFNIDYVANYLSVEDIVEDEYLHRDYLKCLRSA